ncbi:hypothetical protein Churi_gp363 [Pseudomonas phage Churi]|nr:hypothetical protein Churi01_gp363 [Pseudomonas phage Churi01]
MFEALLFTPLVNLKPIVDAIDIYEGSLPPSASFQVIDLDNTVTEPEVTSDDN